MSSEGGATPQPADAGRERSGRRSAIIVAVLVLLAAVAYLFFTEGPGERVLSPAGSTVAEFSGTGDEVTDTFSVREGWTIHWENVGVPFSVSITGDREFGTIVDQDEPATGVTSIVGEGAFRLEVEADDEWEIRIVQGD